MENAATISTSLPPVAVEKSVTGEEHTVKRELPSVTTSVSETYIHGLALASARASATDPLSLTFQAEKRESKSIDDLDEKGRIEMIYDSCVNRLKDKISRGAFIAEAASFAAVACWEPLESNNYPKAGHLSELAKQKPLYAEFVEKQEAAKQKYLYPICEKYWHLSMMARDPTVPYVPGAVRAVLVPFVHKFVEEERVPVWLEAGSQKARDVYAHFGFKEVGIGVVKGIETWFMIYTGS